VAEHEITKRLIEQLEPIMVAMRSRIETELSDADKAVIVDALVDAAVVGGRIARAQIVTRAAEQGIELPGSLRVEDHWPD
jgi:hypothetical protein